MEDWQREAYLSVASRWESDDPDERASVAVATTRDDEGWLEFRYGWHGVPPGGEPGPRCGQVIERGRLRGRGCPKFAGQGTPHLGVGRCVAHRGAFRRGRAEGAWIVGHAFARELECSPWEALLRAVRIAAGKVAYTEWVLAQATNDLELEGRFGRSEDGGLLLHPDTGEPLGGGQLRNLAWWVQRNELWVDRLAKYGKLAIDAGVAERLVQQVEVEGQAVGRVLSAALGELEGEVSDELLARVRGAFRRELLALEAETSSGSVSRERNADARVVDSTYVDEPKE